MRLLSRIAVAVALAAALPNGAASQPAAPTRPRTAAKASPRLSDSQLEALIRAKFAKSKIDADRFTVRVREGIATIEGRTDVIQHKGVATRMARTAGAIAVNNHIQIGDAARRKAAGNLEQGRKRAEVRRGEPRSQSAVSGTGH